MNYLTSKTLVHKFMKTISHEHVIGGISKETHDLAIALAKSIDADEEALRNFKKSDQVNTK